MRSLLTFLICKEAFSGKVGPSEYKGGVLGKISE